MSNNIVIIIITLQVEIYQNAGSVIADSNAVQLVSSGQIDLTICLSYSRQ